MPYVEVTHTEYVYVKPFPWKQFLAAAWHTPRQWCQARKAVLRMPDSFEAVEELLWVALYDALHRRDVLSSRRIYLAALQRQAFTTKPTKS